MSDEKPKSEPSEESTSAPRARSRIEHGALVDGRLVVRVFEPGDRLIDVDETSVAKLIASGAAESSAIAEAEAQASRAAEEKARRDAEDQAAREKAERDRAEAREADRRAAAAKAAGRSANGA